MNTASRLCDSAHRLEKDLVISNQLYQKLDKNTDYIFSNLGEQTLKGKDVQILVYSVEKME
jgi:class 3 adenylate cyclase